MLGGGLTVVGIGVIISVCVVAIIVRVVVVGGVRVVTLDGVLPVSEGAVSVDDDSVAEIKKCCYVRCLFQMCLFWRISVFCAVIVFTHFFIFYLVIIKIFIF